MAYNDTLKSLGYPIIVIFIALLGKKRQKTLHDAAPNPPKPHRHQDGAKHPKRFVVYAIIIVAAVVALYYVFFLSVNQTVVSAPATTNITQSGKVFEVNSQQYFIALASTSPSSAKAYVLVTKMPILLNPILNVTLSVNNITKINAGTSYANMGIQLINLGGSQATVKVSPLFTSLQISPDSQDIRTSSGELYVMGNVQQAAQQPGTQQKTTASTTVSVSTTSASTTTVSSVNQTKEEIYAALKVNGLYGLMLNMSVLYANTSSCTLAAYNSAYVKANGALPKAPNDFANVSQNVPYNISESIAAAGSGDYSMIFKTHTANSFYDNKTAAIVTVNPSTGLSVSENLTGVFQDLTYPDLLNNYHRAQNIGGPCGIEV